VSQHSFDVSVVIPVYNSASTLRTAVESALRLAETSEVLLVEDQSPDNALDVCNQLSVEDKRVRVLQHPERQNRGAGASRNLGIAHARSEFVAFLDADDWYLENRFDADRELLQSDDSIDGVYNALGHHYESEDLRKNWFTLGHPDALTFNRPPTPEDLPLVLLHSHPEISGSFHTNCITVRRSFLKKTGPFHEGLRLRQDVHMWFRMSVQGRLVAGQIAEPVAVQRVHSQNRMTRTADHIPYADLWWRDIGRFVFSNCSRGDVRNAYRRGFCYHLAATGSRLELLKNLVLWTLCNPRILFASYHDFDTVLRLGFSDSAFVNRFLSAKNRIVRFAGIRQ
jgi:glycosyltransferase involved in cell wall biosynthesis